MFGTVRGDLGFPGHSHTVDRPDTEATEKQMKGWYLESNSNGVRILYGQLKSA